jgi:outer membrane protein assembly factor BamB
MHRGSARFLALLTGLLISQTASAQKGRVVVKLVSDFESAKPVSELEEIRPITTMRFTDNGSTEALLGEHCVFWVRNAHIDRKFFFERYYQDRYINRSATLDIDAKELGAGKHIIQPGNHTFSLDDKGALSSDDPDIRIKGNTVLLRMYRVDVLCADASKTGPAEFRLVPSELGVLALDPTFTLDRKKLPDPRRTLDPRKPPMKGQLSSPLVNLLSQQKQFLPLSLWLPSNQQGQGYLLYPSWQTFHVKPGGAVVLAGGDGPRVPGVEAQGSSIVVPHYPMSGKIPGKTGLSAGVGAVPLSDRMTFGATLAPVQFQAGLRDPRNEPPMTAFAAALATLGGPLPGSGANGVVATLLAAKPTGVSLPIDNDLSRRPSKFFVADNFTINREAIRLMVLEWDRPILPRNGEARVGLRFLDSPLSPTLAKPEVRVSWSPYVPSNPLHRLWQPLRVIEWKNGIETGELRFTAPDIDFQFVVIRVEIAEAGDTRGVSLLTGEISGCVVSPEQKGSASFAASKGRSAFVAGEDIELTLVLRSKETRQAGDRSVILTYPDAHIETLHVRDTGEKWLARSLRIPAARSLQLPPGKYTLTVRDLPSGTVAIPYQFDLAGRQKPSLFHIVKPSKYTQEMNNLEPSHLRGMPIDLARAMRTLAEMGYTRVDHMAYMTNHHQRAYTWREELAAGDDRLPAPESVFTPTPRDQMLDACVRHQLQYADIWLSYGDFALPRYIEPYIRSSERWMAREVQAMRYSPAWDGLILYDEMYQNAAVGFVKEHATWFNKVRARVAEDKLGKTPKKIEEDFSRYLARSKDQRDPKALQAFLDYSNWQQLGWKDYIDRVVTVGRELSPRARFGTYHRTWMLPGTSDDLYNGYPPDLFEKLDIIGHIHYADNSTSWVSIPQMARILRTGQNKTLYVNMPILHEVRTQWDGQYQRHMAFALLAQGANGISQWGMATTFEDGPNPLTAQARETTAILNREILQPFGEIVDRTGEGYRKVGIVSTKNQMALSAHKSVPPPCQTEGLWIACWRLGYPALFVREEHCKEVLTGYSVLFVPGVRFAGELDEAVVKRLREAIATGTRVVVEADSVLDLPGITKLTDWKLESYYLGDNYFPTWLDDELNKVYEKSQPIVDYLRPKFKEWDVEPAATGPFKVGPGWRDGGEAQYLIMANFEDPDYGHTVKQQMAKPVLMPLEVANHRGKVAYDLLAGNPIPLEESSRGRKLNIDMRRIQGAIIAMLPEHVGLLRVSHAVSGDGGAVKLQATLIGEKGKALDAVFPARITLIDGEEKRTFFRVLGRELSFELDLPRSAKPKSYRIEVREALSGRTVVIDVQAAKLEGASIELASEDGVAPRAGEVSAFLKKTKQAVIVPGRGLQDGAALAKEAKEKLDALGIKSRIADENSVYHIPTGDPKSEDPLGDGYHSWHSGQEVIAPGMVVEEAVILLAGRRSSFLLDALTEHGYLSDAPLGEPGLAIRPSIQVAKKGLSVQHDTLCLIANEPAGMRQAIARLAGEWQEKPALAKPVFGSPTQKESTQSSPSMPVVSFMGTNELVMDVQQDRDGNYYIITWGHGKNLYSLTADGKPRFSRYLPEMGANRLSVHNDRLYVYTSAGARLYALTLDGTPLGQARLNMDPGPANQCDDYSLSDIDYLYLADKHLLLHNNGDRMRVLDDQYRIVAEWRGEEFRDRDVSDEILRRTPHAFVLSPDRTRIAQLEASWYFAKSGEKDRQVFDTHLVIRDLTGKLLHEFKHIDNGFGVEARLLWPADAPGPIVYAKEERWAFGPELSYLGRQPARDVLFTFRDEACLVRQDRWLVYHDRFNHPISKIGPFETIPSFAALSADGKRLAFLDEYGQLSIYQSTDGKQNAKVTVPERGKVLAFTGDSKKLILGTFRGNVIAYDLTGKQLWQTTLGEQNDALGRDLPLVDPAFVDHTNQLWPVSRDEPGELEKLVRMDVDRLGDGAWKGPVTRADSGILKIGEKMVGQEVTGFLGAHVTWVLDFQYRSATGDKAELLAGLLAQSENPDSVARRFPADDTWRYGRVVIKNGVKCEKLKVGFSATFGEVLLDKVQLRRVRFPSVNHMLYQPFHAVKPVMLENLLLMSKYNPFGGMKDNAPNRVLLPNTPTGSIPLLDSSYLQNGRLNDVTSHWYNQPPFLGQDVMLSLGMKEPRWVNMVVLYFNAYDAERVTPHFDILASDLETKTDRLVASVRHNGQVMRIVKFAPVRTSLVKVRLVNAIARLRTITEIEVYGPLSGKEGVPGFDDPEGQNTYMGDFTRVDKRLMKLPANFKPPATSPPTNADDRYWHAPLAQPLVARDSIIIGRAYGQSTAHPLMEPLKETYRTRANGMGFAPLGTLYGGLILRGGIDGKLYCLHPDGGAVLWSATLGDRLFGCPVAVGEDVFMPCEKNLYQVDLASGGILKVVPLSGMVQGSLACDGKQIYIITDDGYLQAYSVSELKPLWKTPIARYSDSTPAVDGGIVYLADQKGTVRAVSATDGKELWKSELADEFSRCPVVSKDRIILGCRGGTLAVLDRATGKAIWSKKVPSRFDYEPLLFENKLLYFKGKSAMLADIADGKEKALTYGGTAAQPATSFGMPQDPVTSIAYYKGSLILVDRAGETWHDRLYVNHPWHPTGGEFFVLLPVEKP